MGQEERLKSFCLSYFVLPRLLRFIFFTPLEVKSSLSSLKVHNSLLFKQLMAVNFELGLLQWDVLRIVHVGGR